MAWLPQKREDMTERDWRIFREDFSIAYKGAAMGPNSLPIRNWAEANLSEKLMKSIERLVRVLCAPAHSRPDSFTCRKLLTTTMRHDFLC